jgi:hypothetical protein
MSDNPNVIFGSLVNNGVEISFKPEVVGVGQSQNTEVVSVFSFQPEAAVPKLEDSTFYQTRQEPTESMTGSDRKRGRRAIYDESSLDDILGQCNLSIALINW